MTYSSSGLTLVRSGFNSDVPSEWVYKSTDPATDVDADGYITDAKEQGMKVGDLVNVHDTNASPYISTRHTVTEINTDGSANLSNSDNTDSD
jgi:hypothetical protein